MELVPQQASAARWGGDDGHLDRQVNCVQQGLPLGRGLGRERRWVPLKGASTHTLADGYVLLAMETELHIKLHKKQLHCLFNWYNYSVITCRRTKEGLLLTHGWRGDGEGDVPLCLSRELRVFVSGVPRHTEAHRQVAAPRPQDGGVGERHLQKMTIVWEVGVPGRLRWGRRIPLASDNRTLLPIKARPPRVDHTTAMLTLPTTLPVTPKPFKIVT